MDEAIANEPSLKIFRLTEYLPLIVVNDEVKQELERLGFSGVAFIGPEKLVL